MWLKHDPLTWHSLLTWQGYAYGSFAPGRCSDRSSCPYGNSSQEPYTVGHFALLAHAKAVQVYRSKYQVQAGGAEGGRGDGVGMVKMCFGETLGSSWWQKWDFSLFIFYGSNKIMWWNNMCKDNYFAMMIYSTMIYTHMQPM